MREVGVRRRVMRTFPAALDGASRATGTLMPRLRIFALAGFLVASGCSGASDDGLSRPRGATPANHDDGNDRKDDETKAPSNPEKPQEPQDPAKPAEPTKPAVDATNGSGGPTGRNTLKSAGNLSYIIDAPAPVAGKARGLLVLLHGSTASNYTSFVDKMAQVAQQYDLIRVSALAPNGQGWNEGNQTNAANLLHRLVQEDLFPKYNIDRDRVMFSGQSSGGGFLSSHFVPLYGKEYKGGAFFQCGAAPPFQSFTPTAQQKAKFKLHFEITTGDTIWPQLYAQSVSAYTNAGMSLTKDDTKPGGHCQFDQQKVIQDHITTLLAH
jgi:predicted esterase